MDTLSRNRTAVLLDETITKVCRKFHVEDVPSLGNRHDKFPEKVISFINNAVSRALGEMQGVELSDDEYISMLRILHNRRSEGRLDYLGHPPQITNGDVILLCSATEEKADAFSRRLRADDLSWYDVLQKIRTV